MASRSFTQADTTNIQEAPLFDDGSLIDVELKQVTYKEGTADSGFEWANLSAMLVVTDILDASTNGKPFEGVAADAEPIFYTMSWPRSSTPKDMLPNMLRTLKRFYAAFEIDDTRAFDIAEDGKNTYLIYGDDGSRVSGGVARAVTKIREYNGNESNDIKYFADPDTNEKLKIS